MRHFKIGHKMTITDSDGKERYGKVIRSDSDCIVVETTNGERHTHYLNKRARDRARELDL